MNIIKAVIFTCAVFMFTACAGQTKKQESPLNGGLIPLKAQSIYSHSDTGKKTVYPGSKQTLAQLPVVLAGDLLLLGKNIILQLLKTENNFLALSLSVTNPAQAQSDLYFDAPARINLAAQAKDGSYTLLKLYTSQGVYDTLKNTPSAEAFTQARLFLTPVELYPGESKSGVLFFEDIPSDKYKLTLVNENEVFEVIFINGKEEK